MEVSGNGVLRGLQGADEVAELPPDTAPEDVKKTFGAYGTVVDCRVMTGTRERVPLPNRHLL